MVSFSNKDIAEYTMKVSGQARNQELLIGAKNIAEQKGVTLELVIDILEQAIQAAARKKYGQKKIKASIDQNTGDISLARQLKVISDDDVNTEERPDAESYDFISLSQALVDRPDAKIGDIAEEQLPYFDIDRAPARIMRQVIFRLMHKMERDKQYDDYKNRVGTVVSGIVKRLEKGGLVADISGNEAYIPSRAMIKGEVFRRGDRIKAYIEEARKESAGYQIFLSRTSPKFMIELFKQEVPEVYDGIVEIKGVARMPGSRAKVAVYATDSNIDPVGACVGVRGVRIQAISSELHGEKIDVIHYSSDLATYMVNALTPAEVVKVIIDDDGKKIEVAVPDSKLNIAIGRRGQNVSLVSELVGWRISIIGEEVESARRTEEFELGTELFVKALNVEETIAQLLVTEGFVSISDIAGSSIAEIANIEGFNNEIASEIKDRAIKYLESPTSETQESLCKTGISENLAKIPGIGLDLLVKLGKTDIKARKDLAELSTDEFTDLISDSGLSKEQIDKIIIHAREQEGWLDG